MRIDGCRIVLTGAASGIGRATLARLSAYGATIVAADVDAGRLAEAVAEVKAETACRAAVSTNACDLADPACVEGLFQDALDRMGGIDLFIANAGFAYYELLDRADYARLEQIYRVNVLAPLYAAVRMRELNRGRPHRTVIIASGMGLIAIPGYAVYGATKASLDRFAEGFRLELEDPRSLALVYPIGTRTAFFGRAAEGDAPHPWPTQTPEQVAGAIVRGIEADRTAIYPSALFVALLWLDRFLPGVRRLEQRLEGVRFRRWLAGRG